MPTFEEEKQAAKLDAPGKVEMTVGGRNIPIQEMTPEDVGKWLDDQGLGDLSSAFVRHKITGACPQCGDVPVKQHQSIPVKHHRLQYARLVLLFVTLSLAVRTLQLSAGPSCHRLPAQRWWLLQR
mmetsp:Transcript_12727/g.35807  ORF Transcript_12727/g.35807 Transcript_12727/m.35807 type:complete len:125 (-) Transcript_12727:934-1308(-)